MVKRMEEAAAPLGIRGIDLLVHMKADARNFWRKPGYKKSEYIHMEKNVYADSSVQ